MFIVTDADVDFFLAPFGAARVEPKGTFHPYGVGNIGNAPL